MLNQLSPASFKVHIKPQVKEHTNSAWLPADHHATDVSLVQDLTVGGGLKPEEG